MAIYAANRIKVSTTTMGTADFGLGSATSSAFRSFSAAGIPDGATVHYSAYTATEFECGEGVYTASGPTLSRDTIIASSNSDNIVTFGSSPTVIIGPLAEKQLIKLTEALDVYVDGSTGDDTNSGTATAPLETIQAAVDLIADNYINCGVLIRILVAPGTYDNQVILRDIITTGLENSEAGRCMIQGTGSDPSDVVLTVTVPFGLGDVDTIVCGPNTCFWALDMIKIQNGLPSQSGIFAWGARIELYRVEFGACGRALIWAIEWSQISHWNYEPGYTGTGSFKISGASNGWGFLLDNSALYFWSPPQTVIEVDNNPNFTQAFWEARGNSIIYGPDIVYTGDSITGRRFRKEPNSTFSIGTNDPTTYIPGNSAGTGAPVAQVHRSGNQAVSSPPNTYKILFNAEDYDPNGWFDSTTNHRFTPQLAGYYLVTVAVSAENAAGDGPVAKIYKNGSQYALGSFAASDVTFGQTSVCTAIVPMNGSTDYIEGFAYAAASPIYDAGGSTYMSMARVSD